MTTDLQTASSEQRISRVATVVTWVVAAGHFPLAAMAALARVIEPATPGVSWMVCLALILNGSLLGLTGFRISNAGTSWRQVAVLAACWAVPVAITLPLLRFSVLGDLPLEIIVPVILMNHLAAGVIHRSWRVLAVTFVCTWACYVGVLFIIGFVGLISLLTHPRVFH